jgi:hypothetical protein
VIFVLLEVPADVASDEDAMAIGETKETPLDEAIAAGMDCFRPELAYRRWAISILGPVEANSPGPSERVAAAHRAAGGGE